MNHRRRFIIVIAVILLIGQISVAKDAYYLDPSFDGPYLITAATGVWLADRVNLYITPPLINTLVKSDINPLDRFAADYYSPNLRRSGDYMLGMTALPIVIFIYGGNKSGYEYWDAVTDLVIYSETVLFTYSLCHYIRGFEIRPKPYAYNNELDYTVRAAKDAASSFYSLNSALAANAVAFTESVFKKRFPDSGILPLIRIVGWSGAAYMGYTQVKSGEHFLTDVIFGTAIGAVTGYMIPKVHTEIPAVNIRTIIGGVEITMDF